MTTENNVAAQAGDEPMRKDFEAWAWQECWTNAEIMETRTEEGYSLLSLNDAWSVWKAATLATQVSPRATADVERELSDEEIHAVLDALPISYWDVPQDATVMFARAILSTTKPGA